MSLILNFPYPTFLFEVFRVDYILDIIWQNTPNLILLQRLFLTECILTQIWIYKNKAVILGDSFYNFCSRYLGFFLPVSEIWDMYNIWITWFDGICTLIWETYVSSASLLAESLSTPQGNWYLVVALDDFFLTTCWWWIMPKAS